MAYALALKAAQELPIGPVILIDTLIYAFITILGIGSILNPVLSYLGVKRKENEDLDEGESDRKHCCSDLKLKFRKFDSAYFSPLFIKDLKNI